MLILKHLSGNILRIDVPHKLEAGDFSPFGIQVDALIAQHGKVRLLIDATHFDGWNNIPAFSKHMSFIRLHQNDVERVAVLTGHEWQHWLVGVFRLFAHPQVRMFDRHEEKQAVAWLEESA